MFSSVGLNQASLEVWGIEAVSTRGQVLDVERENSDLLKDVMKESVVAVVVHVTEDSM